MSQDVEASEHLSDDDVLRFSQGIRKDLVTDMTKGGLPEDNKDRAMLLTALADMDRVAISNKRIGSQEKANGSNLLVAMAMAKLTENLGGKNPFETDVTPGRTLDADLEKIPDVETVEGEMHIGAEDNCYEEFMKKF